MAHPEHAPAPTTPFEAFKKGLSSRAVVRTPADGEAYVEAKKLWNGFYDDRNPAAIVHVATPSDVIKCVNYARDQNIKITARAGGHSLPGYSTLEGGLVVDFKNMKSIRIDPEQRTALVEPGLTGSEFDAETAAFGLATPLGTISNTGVFGLALHGGYGWLSRRYGLSVDNILEADVVLANGTFVTASATSHPDLFWALRGAASNFGIVTSLKFRLHPVTLVHAKVAGFPIEISEGPLKQLVRLHNDDKFPDELSLHAIFTFAPPPPPGAPAPPRPPGPPPKVLLVVAAYNGPAEQADGALDLVFRELPTPIFERRMDIPYPVLQSTQDHIAPHGRHYYNKGSLLHLDDQTVSFLVEKASTVPAPTCAAAIAFYGGAINRVPSDAMAFPARSEKFGLELIGGWDAADTATVGKAAKEWAFGIFDLLVTINKEVGVYQNFIGNEDDAKNVDRLSKAFGNNIGKLRELKKKYDPNNFFSHNCNIKPE